MAITIADAFMDSVQATLLDPNGVYWSTTELIEYYNIFVTAVISEKPDALTKSVNFAVASGVYQTLPADGVQFIRAPANVSGEGITQVTAQAMTDADPNWYGQPPSPIVVHVIPDERDPLKFRVYPPNDGTGAIIVNYCYAPNDATATTDAFTLTEAYRAAARNAVLGMAYAKNTERGDLAKTQFYFSRLDRDIAEQVQAQSNLLSRVATPKTTE